VVGDEVSRTLAQVDALDFDRFVDERRVSQRRWFCTGQGRSGLVAQMAAMRLIHLGHRTHVVREATAPAITGGDALLVFSASGTTPLSLHFAETARGVSAVVVLTPAATMAAGARRVVGVLPPAGRPAARLGSGRAGMFGASSLRRCRPAFPVKGPADTEHLKGAGQDGRRPGPRI
jgi:fructoselysine-6-P-deglycase FrlB-like protein